MGPFFFSVETMIGLPDIVKITYAVGMLAGRLELLPLVVLITRRAWQ
jgi:trk system potassium uptake protein TrkH